jgi:hypothetical protein
MLGIGSGLFGRRGRREGHTVEVVLNGRSTTYHVYKRPYVDFFLKKVSVCGRRGFWERGAQGPVCQVRHVSVTALGAAPSLRSMHSTRVEERAPSASLCAVACLRQPRSVHPGTRRFVAKNRPGALRAPYPTTCHLSLTPGCFLVHTCHLHGEYARVCRPRYRLA